MKSKSIALIMATLALAPICSPSLHAQTADQLVTEGRAFLSAHNITAANAKFAAAVAANANHETANVLHAATRVLNLPFQPAGAAFLDRLGFLSEGRDLYNWTSRPLKDAQQKLVAPAGVSAQELTWQLRTNALPQIQGALQSLARITNPNFTLSLTSSEASGAAVTLDYADVLVLRSALHFGEYLCYTLHAQNLDAQLTSLRALDTTGEFNAETLLAQYPTLFMYASTNDLAAAQTAFVNMVDRYNEASDKLRLRMNLTRLFNLDAGEVDREDDFRTTLNELRQSVFGPAVSLSHYAGHSSGDFIVDLRTHFSGQHPLRSQLPSFQKNRIVLGSLPQPVLGGLFPAFSRDTVENYLLKQNSLPGGNRTPAAAAVPGLSSPRFAAGGFSLTLRGVRDRAYSLQSVTNLTNSAAWQDVAGGFFAEGNTMRLEDAGASVAARRFYRVVERGNVLPPPLNDNFENRITLTGFPAIGRGYTAGATTEIGELKGIYDRGRTVWWSWTAPSNTSVVLPFTGDAYMRVNVYTGATLGSLSDVPLTYSGGPPTFAAQADSTYTIRVDEYLFGNPGLKGFPVIITAPLSVTLSGVTSGASLASPANLTVTATVSSPVSPVKSVNFFGAKEARLTNAPYSMSVTDLMPGNYYFSVSTKNEQGLYANAFTFFTVTGPVPGNDNFVDRYLLAGASATDESYTGGATAEVDEPSHDMYGAGAKYSIWWEWVAPKSGLVTFTTRGSATSNVLAIYTGNTLGSLVLERKNSYGDKENGSKVRFIAAAGTSYKIAVDGPYSTGTIHLSVNQP